MWLRTGFAKALHVSPFMHMDQSYDLTATVPGERLDIRIEAAHAGSPLFEANLALRRRPLTGPNLNLALIRHPLLTARVTAGHLLACAAAVAETGAFCAASGALTRADPRVWFVCWRAASQPPLVTAPP